MGWVWSIHLGIKGGISGWGYYMRNIKITIEYDGSRYLGWQRQKSTERTIQGKLERVLSLMTGEDIEVIGSGRTDAGVHAYGQVANFKTTCTMDLDEILEYLNHYLPQDIVVKEAVEVHARFHARYHAKSRKYLYRIWNSRIPSAFERKYSYHVPSPLDLDEMRRGAEKLLGTHDFIAFSSLKKRKKSTIRRIDRLDINKQGDLVTIEIIGNAFLRHMVRIIVGTLLEIGLGSETAEYIDHIFKVGMRKEAGMTVPPQGLFLAEVYYDDCTK